ncbi:Multidrug resistance protein 3 [compost metagenome]
MPIEKIARVQALFMSVLAMSSVLGPSIGAFITSNWNWRWNFFINAPLGLVALAVLGVAMTEKKPDKTIRLKIDYAGAILLVTATVSFLLALKMGGTNYAWSSWEIIGLFALGAGALTAFLLVERRAAEPILPLGMFKNRTVAGTASVTFVQGIVLYGAMLYIPIFVQGGMGGDATDAGNAMTPMMLAVMAGASLSSILMRVLTWRASALLSMLIAGAGLYIITLLPLEADKWAIRSDMALIGLGIGILMPIAQTAVSTSVDLRYQGVANSTVTFARNVGGVLGSAIMAAVVNRHMTTSIDSNIKQLGLSPEHLKELANPQVLLQSEDKAPAAVVAMMKSVLVDAIHLGFWFLLIAALVGVAAASLMGRARYTKRALGNREQHHL